MIFSLEFKSSDLEIEKLLRDGVIAFYNVRENQKALGLKTIIDAYDRVRLTLSNSKREANELFVDRIVRSHPTLKSAFIKITDAMNQISNADSSLRHPENNEKDIFDPHVLETLFYMYYVLLRSSLMDE